MKKFQGCLIGGAAGDALGYEVEFSKWYGICECFGEQGIQKYVLHNGKARFSDDTQMTICTLYGLLDSVQTGKSAEECILDAYHDWYHMQEGGKPQNNTPVTQYPSMAALRAPGGTCMSSLGSGEHYTMVNPANDSKGCGGVMRVAPIGLFCGNNKDLTQCDLLAANAAALTHGHPLGYISAAGLAHIVARATYTDMPLKSIISECAEFLPAIFAKDESYALVMSELLTRAIELAENTEADRENISSLGLGWIGEEALAIAVYSALRHENDFSACIRAAVNHSGDSDSTGAIAGNILGAYLGLDAIDNKWLDKLEMKDDLLNMARELYEVSNKTAPHNA